MLTDIVLGVEPGALPPQLRREIVATMSNPITVNFTWLCLTGLRAKATTTMPSAGTQSKKRELERQIVEFGRARVIFGPLVVIASDTVCTPLTPAAIAGLEHIAPAGRPVHAKLTPF